jgi:hypothetical protein
VADQLTASCATRLEARLWQTAVPVNSTRPGARLWQIPNTKSETPQAHHRVRDPFVAGPRAPPTLAQARIPPINGH